MSRFVLHPRFAWLGWRFALVLMAAALASAAQAHPAKGLLDAGRADDAIRTLQERIDQSPSDAEAHNLLCRTYLMLEQWDLSISACERARNLDPQNSTYHLWLGRAYGEKADHSVFFLAAGLAHKARASFERSVELDSKSWEARTDLAEFYVEAPAVMGGGKDKALRQADAIMPLNPGMAHWIYARVAEKEKDPARAESEYRAEIAASHSAIRAWIDYAIFLRHEGRLDDMERALEKLEAGPVDRPEALMDGASLLLRTGRNAPLAIRLLRRYLAAPVEEGPAFRAYDMLGQLLERQGDRRGAAEQYRAAVALARGYPARSRI